MQSPADVRTYVVEYPVSGSRLVIRGVLCCGPMGAGGPFAVGFQVAEAVTVNDQQVPVGGVLLCDLRCRITDVATRRLAYHPRDHMHAAGFDPGLRDWLEEHPEWMPRRKRAANGREG